MVDILVSSQKHETVKRETVKRETGRRIPWNLVLGLALAFVVYDTKYWEKFTPNVVPASSLAEVVFVKCDIMSQKQQIVANSTVIDEVLDKANLARRAVFDDVDLSDAEPFLQEAVELGKGQAPCVVWCRKDGSMDITPMPETIDEMKRQIEENLR